MDSFTTLQNSFADACRRRINVEVPDDLIRYPVIEEFLSTHSFPVLITGQRFHGISDIIRLNEILSKLPNSRLIASITHTDLYQLYFYQDKKRECLIEVETRLHGTRDIEDFDVTCYGTKIIPSKVMYHLRKSGFLPEKQKTKEIDIQFAFPSANGGTRVESKSFSPIMFDAIRKNYVPSIQIQVDALLETLKTVNNGLIVLHGPTGGGKTYLIRSILSELRQIKTGVVCSPALTFLNNPDLINQAILKTEDDTKPIIIFEDLGEVFSKTAKIEYMESFSNLINLTDGLLSILSSAVYILTFNYEASQIDQAIIRPGRCIDNIFIPRLPKKQALSLISDVNNVPEQNDYSLAEVYAYKMGRTPSLSKSIKPPLGFSGAKKEQNK